MDIVKRLQKLIQTTAVEGGVLALIFGFSAILLGANVIRVIANGRNNYEVFLYEKSGLEKLEADNERLMADKNYYSSDEYKMLYLRDTQNLAQPGETIYTLREKPIYLEEKKNFIDLSQKGEYFDWWKKLLI